MTPSLNVCLLLDGGSQKSYISECACDRLGLVPYGEHVLSIATFGSHVSGTTSCPIVDVQLQLPDSSYVKLPLYVVPMICEPLTGQPMSIGDKRYQHLRGLKLADPTSRTSKALPMDVLIGADTYWRLMTGKVHKGFNGPTAIHTRLGWVLSGPSDPVELCHSATSLVTHVLHVQEATLDHQLQAFWELETLGISDKGRTLYDRLTEVIKFKNGRYKVLLPWKEIHDSLPDNHEMCLMRLQSLLRRLRHDPAILNEYHQVMQDQLEQGVIELVSTDESNSRTVHYLPHHPVIRRDKSTSKVRIVYDASAKSPGLPSLNDCLFKGPKFDQLIFDILLRFRLHKVALIGDLEKAFLMIAIEEGDRDALRFLWVEDVSKDPPVIRAYRFTRVVFAVSSSPFLLNGTVRYHLEQHLERNEGLVRKLIRSAYVDDIISGAETEENAFKMYCEAKRLFREGGFNLQKFRTNSSSLQARLDKAEELDKTRCNTGTSVEESDMQTTQVTRHSHADEVKVLGIQWNPVLDVFIFDFSKLLTRALRAERTKRGIVKIISSFYDPVGYAAPITIRFKIFLQELY